jgi:trimeric autotransporter adhesin
MPLRAVLGCVLVLASTAAAFATNYTVTDKSDSAADTGSLRYAINIATDGDTITFASNVIGAIALANGSLTTSHSITITGPGAGLLTISGNNAVTVFTVSSGTVSISGLSIAKGNAGSGSYGGAILNEGTLILTGCDLFNNASPANNGGAIYSVGTLTVVDSIFSGNTTGAGGGGAIAASGALTVENSTFSNNTSSAGGAVFNNAGTATVENSTFFGNNSGSGPGGGIFNNGAMTVNNSTVAGNVGGGIFNNGGQTVTVVNSIVADNTPPGNDCGQCGTQSSNNLIGRNPDLGPLQFNGGITQTIMPLPGSLAIGAGMNSTLSTDQRGFARSTIGNSDLGAVQTNYLTVTNLSDSGAGSLRQAISDAIASFGSSGDIIFQSGLTGTIQLASPLPEINTSDVTITGPGANVLTASENFPTGVAEPILDISGSPSVVNLRGLTIANGSSSPGSGMPGGLFNNGLLTTEDVAFLGNAGDTGGGILNQGDLVVINSTFSNNSSDNAGGGGILNYRTLITLNTTFSRNRAYNTSGGAIDNHAVAKVENSTISGNEVLNGGVGGGIYSTEPLVVENDIISGNTNLQSNTEDDCTGCSGGTNLIGGAAGLATLTYNGLNATVQTMIPLPGSAAIQAGDPTQLLPIATSDERGFPRLTDGKLDLGAVQTNYTSVNFVQQPTTTLVNTDISPAVTVNVLETNGNLPAPNNTDAVDGVPITLTFSGTGTLAGTLTQTSSGGAASFGDLQVNAAGTGDSLATAVTIVGSQTLLATSSPFDIVLPAVSVSFNPAPPASVTYGVAPISLGATVVNSSNQPTGQVLAFQVDSGPATVSGNALSITGAGTVVMEADAAANGTYNAADATASIHVNTAPLTVTAANATRAYGAANPTFTGTYAGAVNGDVFTAAGSTTATATSPNGSYRITPAVTGTNLADYAVTYVNGTLTVAQAVLNVGAANATRVYGTPNPAFTGSIAGAVNGDQFSESFSTAVTQSSSAGTYAIVPAVAGTNLADYTVVVSPGILTVSKASSVLALAASASQITPGSSVTFTATTTSSTTGMPTGTVVFSSGSTRLGTAMLNGQGVAALAITTLPVGSNTVTASYSGDTDILESQMQLSGAVVVGNSSFNMTVTPGSMSIQPGHAGIATVTLTPTLGYTGTINFSCSGMPQQSGCHFQPASVTLSGSRSPVQVTLAIQIGTPSYVKSHRVAWLQTAHPLRSLPVLPAMFFWPPGTEEVFEDRANAANSRKRKPRRILWLIALLTIGTGVLAIAGCAGLAPSNPPAGRQTITVIALGSGGVNQSANVNLTIQ